MRMISVVAVWLLVIGIICSHGTVALDSILNQMDDKRNVNDASYIDQCDGDINILQKVEIVAPLMQETIKYDEHFLETVTTCAQCVETVTRAKSCGKSTVAWESTCKCNRHLTSCRCLGSISIVGYIVIIVIPVIFTLTLCCFGACICREKSARRKRSLADQRRMRTSQLQQQRQTRAGPYPTQSPYNFSYNNNGYAAYSAPNQLNQRITPRATPHGAMPRATAPSTALPPSQVSPVSQQQQQSARFGGISKNRFVHTIHQ